MDGKQIIMSYTVPPSIEDLGVMAGGILETLPDELTGFCTGLAIRIEDFADASTEQELDLEDVYDLLALYRSGKEIAPGIEKKTANDDDILILYRRPILDMWCEGGEDLCTILRQTMIEELGRHFDFSDDEIDDMTSRHYQGML
jgi:predicted Zn-dependent protease with MMP-like domain